jgi:putative acetyltransferase
MIKPGLIRRADAQDGLACATIINAWIDTTPWMPRCATPEVIQTALTQGLPLREAYVIGDPVAGYISIDPRAAHIWGFYVATPGQGFGKALMDRAKQGRTYLKLNTHAANTKAHAFYRREGFIETRGPWLGDDGIEEITMVWRASPQ